MRSLLREASQVPGTELVERCLLTLESAIADFRLAREGCPVGRASLVLALATASAALRKVGFSEVEAETLREVPK